MSEQYVEEVVYDALTSVFNGRVYPGVAPDGVDAPYAVQSVPSDVPENTLGNGAVARNVTLQLDTYALTLKEARDLAKSAESALCGLTGDTMGVTLQLAQTVYESEVRMHRVMQQFYFLLPRSGGVL